MSKITILHNPRCSKSRQTLALLEENGIELDIILYLQDTPSVDELNVIVKKLGINARELLRRGEQEYKENNLSDNGLNDSELLSFMHAFPKLIERPVVIKGDKAVIGRPPEKVLELIQ